LSGTDFFGREPVGFQQGAGGLVALAPLQVAKRHRSIS
jgi:hypothetical protein